MFFHFVVKLNVLVDFCESLFVKSGVVSKVYAFDSACFWKKCIRYFYLQCAFNNVGHIWLMSSSRCWVMSPLWQGQEIYFLENDLGLTRRIKESCFKAWKHERKWLRAEIFQYRLTLSHCQKILSVKFPSPSNNQSSSIKLIYYSTHYETFWPSSN